MGAVDPTFARRRAAPAVPSAAPDADDPPTPSDAPHAPGPHDRPHAAAPPAPSGPPFAPGAPSASVELALDEPPEPRLATVQVSRDDKAVFDALQAWWLFRRGRRLTQWEMFSVLLGDALENERGELSAARRAL